VAAVDLDSSSATKQARSKEEQERLDRQLIELLNEVRVAMPGVQVLFGFLLTVPFQQRFAEATSFQRGVYFVTLVAAAAATALFIAPSAYHRIVFQMGEKQQLIRQGNRQLVAGLVALAVAMNGAVLLVTDFLFSAPTVIVTIVALAAMFFTLWFGLGLFRRRRLNGDGCT
jgi:uncharacterized protein DUF6328